MLKMIILPDLGMTLYPDIRFQDTSLPNLNIGTDYAKGSDIYIITYLSFFINNSHRVDRSHL